MLNRLRKRADLALAELNHARRQVQDESKALKNAKEYLKAVGEARTLVQEVAAGVQAYATAQVSQIVTRCLEAVFPEPYQFQIRFDQKRGRTEARFVLLRDGVELDDLLEEVGGSVAQVVSFALRLACLVLSKPQGRRLLVLDEPFTGVSRENHAGLCRLIEALAEEWGLQVIIVSHQKSLMMGRVVEL